MKWCQLTKNLCYIVLDCDEHDGKLRCDLEHRETGLMPWVNERFTPTQLRHKQQVCLEK